MIPLHNNRNKYRIKKYENGGGTPDIKDLLNVLSKSNAKFNDPEHLKLLEAAGSTYAQDAVNRGYDYHDRWQDSARYKQNTRESLFPTYDESDKRYWQIQNNPALQASLMQSLNRSRPKEGDKDWGTNRKDIKDSLAYKFLQRTSDESLDSYYNDSNDGSLWSKGRGKSLKKELRKAGVDIPRVKGLSRHEERLLVANQMVEKYQNESIDRVFDYTRMMGERNPLDVQESGNSLETPIPWRPGSEGEGEKMYDASGAVDQRLSDKTGFSVEGKASPTSNLSISRKIKDGKLSSPHIMGLPTGFQQSWKPGSVKLSKDPMQLENTALHERAHQLDLPRQEFNFMEDTISNVNRIDSPESEYKKYNDYVAIPSETNARIHILRKHLFSAGIDVFNKPVDFNSIPKNILDDLKSMSDPTTGDSDALSDLQSIYSDKDIQMMLNTLR